MRAANGAAGWGWAVIALDNNLTLVPGDAVLVPATVVDSAGPGEHISLIFSCGGYAASTREGVQVSSFILAVGDEVRAVEAMHLIDEKVWPHGIVVAVNDGWAWVRWPLGDSLEPLARLQRVRTAQQVADFAPRPNEFDANEAETGAQGADVGESGDWHDPVLDADRAGE